MRTSSLFLVLALATCACKGESAAAPQATHVFISVANDGEGQRPPEGFTGTWVDVAPGVEFRQTLVMATGAATTNESRINGHRFVVEGEHVVIGPKRYGPLAAGAYVEIRNEGVFADAKLLGPLPERIAMPPDGQ